MIGSGIYEKGDTLDSIGFISDIEKEFVPIAPIVEFAINKQMQEVGASKEYMNPKQALEFIDNMADALEMFLGKDKARDSRKFMISTLRKHAPEHFEESSLI